MTVYEKKCYSLKIQFLKNLGYDEGFLKEINTLNEIESLLSAADFLQRLNTVNGLNLMLELDRELKDAEKLKTAVDIQRDKEKKAESERKKEIEIAKQKERERQAQIKKKEEEMRERYENSDYVAIGSRIKENFNDWYKKGEFEKSEDHQIRISSFSAQAFDSICYNILVKAFKRKSGFSSELLKYNADTEKFGIEFKFNDLILIDSLNIPINIAAKFKNEFNDFDIYVPDKDWVFIDNYLSPKKIYLYNKMDKSQNVEFHFSNSKEKSIAFSPSDFGINLSSTNNKFIFDDYSLNSSQNSFEKEQYDDLKSSFENQGKPNGDFYSGNSGTGNSGIAITKGLKGRNIITFPSFEDDFNENAKIAMNIKVDENGRVLSADYSTAGSTSSSEKLKDIAYKKALQLKFNPGEGESLGTVVFNFRLKG